ncbi:VQ motif-containing protein 11-like [Typha latifolia]|uniref:VQ motif-containing protein 11-like n=1 Tax=Typha latifolia TaxID=4733 RepID=UPI003C2BD951
MASTGDSDPNSPSTTYVHADPSTFRSIVQKLTGYPNNSPHYNVLPHNYPPLPSAKRQKLQERRKAPTKLDLNLLQSPLHLYGLSSPVSTVDASFLVSSSPSTPTTPSPSSSSTTSLVALRFKKEIKEEKAIVEKGFYLHPSPRSHGKKPPKLLPLFPVDSPRDSA